MDIQDLRIFARVAAVQNLSAVGTELGLTPGTISKRLQALEEELNARLFDRTTRSIRITEEGATFLVHARKMLEELDLARAAVGENVTNPKGKLKISAPASLCNRFIAPAVCAFVRCFPEIEVQVDVTDRLVNLQEEGYDVAIRSGVLTDSALIAKRLASDHQIIVASPAYLAEQGTPISPVDLPGHKCLVLGDGWTWAFDRDNETPNVRISASLRSDNGELLRHAALAGLGLLRTSEILVGKDLRDGRLVRVFPNYEMIADTAIWAVYPGPKHVLPKLRVFLDFLAEWFRVAQEGPSVKPYDAPQLRQTARKVTS